jgi:hypothetical protein
LSAFNSSSALSSLSSSYLSSSLDSSTEISSSSSSSPSSSTESGSDSTTAIAGIGGVDAGTASSSPSSAPSGGGHGRNGTLSKGPNDSTSPPVVAGAVVGSVGGMAVLLLLLVLVARWWKHHSRSVRYESGGDSATDLTTHPGQPGPPRPHRRSFLPVGAAAFMNRLSGGHNRSSSPTLPNVAERASTQERGFQKIAGRKMPSQFATGMEEGPVTREFEKPVDRRLAAVGQAMSPSSSYYRDSNDTTNFFATHARGSHPAPQPLFAASSSDEPSPEAGPSNIDKEIIRPSPARTPNITTTNGPYFRDFSAPSPPPSPGRQGHTKFAEHVH